MSATLLGTVGDRKIFQVPAIRDKPKLQKSILSKVNSLSEDLEAVEDKGLKHVDLTYFVL